MWTTRCLELCVVFAVVVAVGTPAGAQPRPIGEPGFDNLPETIVAGELLDVSGSGCDPAPRPTFLDPPIVWIEFDGAGPESFYDTGTVGAYRYGDDIRIAVDRAISSPVRRSALLPVAPDGTWSGSIRLPEVLAGTDYVLVALCVPMVDVIRPFTDPLVLDPVAAEAAAFEASLQVAQQPTTTESTSTTSAPASTVTTVAPTTTTAPPARASSSQPSFTG